MKDFEDIALDDAGEDENQRPIRNDAAPANAMRER